MLNIYNLPGDRFKSDVQRNVVAHARGKFAGIEFAALDHRGGVGADGILFKHGVRAVEKRGYGQGTGLVMPLIVRLPSMLTGLSPSKITLVDLKVAVGNLAVSKIGRAHV